MTLTPVDATRALARREAAGRALIESSDAIAAACQAMANRLAAGGTLFVFGNGSSATDAAHIAVEFVHPVIVGKRALPAMSLANDTATLTGVACAQGFDEVFRSQIALRSRPEDMALGLSADGRCCNVRLAIEEAHARGLLTVLMAGGDGSELASNPAVDHLLLARSNDALVVKEIQVTTYHILWELVHVFFEQSAPLGPRDRHG